MVKILHFSDSHVSHRKFNNVRDSWKINNRIRWIEDDFARGFKGALDIAANENIDYLIHSGDLFDVPVSRNLASPTEYSRAFVIKELHNFFDKTNYKVPFILIDGNHGTYLYRNYSTLEFLEAAFPKYIHIATNYDLKKAIVEDKPLMVEFDDVNFYLFPYFKFGRSSAYDKRYDQWIRNNQQPDPKKLNIAVAHGIIKGEELHDLVLELPYDYIALGHDHQQKKVAKNAWQAGSTEKYTFYERNDVKGVLVADIQKDKEPIVNTKAIERTRNMREYELVVNKKTTVEEFEKEIKDVLDLFQDPFDGETAYRVKIKVKGNALMTTWWTMEDLLVDFQKKIFAGDYNILEFRWDATEVQRSAPMAHGRSAKIYDYLIEDPAKDFERYIRSLDIEDQEQAKKYIDSGAKIIEEIFSGKTEEE